MTDRAAAVTGDTFHKYFAVANVSGLDVPPHSVVRVVRLGDREIPEVDQVDEDDYPPFELLVTGPVTIPAGAEGQATYDVPAAVRYASDDPYAYDPESCNCDDYGFDYFGPADAERHWGTRAGSWALHRGNRGWFVLGGARSCFVFAVRDPAAALFPDLYDYGCELTDTIKLQDIPAFIGGQCCTMTVTIGPLPFKVPVCVETDCTYAGSTGGGPAALPDFTETFLLMGVGE
jgi:hypothetical protein